MRDYLAVGRDLSAKVQASLLGMGDQPVAAAHGEALAYFHRRLDKPLDWVERRRLPEETIPAHEKVFSLFEPHPEWIQKGKQRPNVELGHRLLIATDQPPLIQADDEPVGAADVDQSVPVADRLLGRSGPGRLARLSFDKGFTRTEARELLNRYVPTVVRPKRGQKNAAETEHESEKRLVALRRAHRAVESDINRLEHHGLNRGLDAGLPGYRRSVGYGVMSDNLHVIGRELLARQRARTETVRLAACRRHPGNPEPSSTGAGSLLRENLEGFGVVTRKISHPPPRRRPQRPAPLPKPSVSGQILSKYSTS